MKDKATMNMLVSICGDMLEVGKTNEVTMEDISRVNDVAQDALKESPETELGRKAKATLAEEVALGAQSKYYQIEFDFNVHLNEVARPAVVEFTKMLGTNPELIGYFGGTADQEMIQNELVDKLAFNLLQILKDHTPIAYYEQAFGKIRNLIDKVEKQVLDQVNGNRDEVVSIRLGAKNPKYKKYDARHATYQDVLNAVEAARASVEGYDPKRDFMSQL